jgi:hypothetical protein
MRLTRQPIPASISHNGYRINHNGYGTMPMLVAIVCLAGNLFSGATAFG